MCALLVGSAGNAYASEEDDIYYGDFMGEEYPIYPIDPDISYFATLNGYTYYMSYLNESTGKYVTFNNTVTFPTADTNRRLLLSLYLPEAVSVGSVIDVVIKGSYGGSASSSAGTLGNYWTIVYSEAYSSVANEDDFLSHNFNTKGGNFSYVGTGMIANGDVKIFEIYLDLFDAGTEWGMYITDIQVTISTESISDVEDSKNIKNIFEAILELPSNFANSIKGFFDSVVNAVTSVYNAVVSLPAKIKESLSSLFQSLQDAVVALAGNIADRFTSIFDGWYDTDAELDESVKDSWEIGSGLELDESELIEDALSDINHIDFIGGFTGELVTALLWLLPFQDRLYNSLGLVKDVVVVALTIGLVTLLLGRGLRTLANYGGKR